MRYNNKDILRRNALADKKNKAPDISKNAVIEALKMWDKAGKSL